MGPVKTSVDGGRRVLLTGATGFVGSTLAGVLARAGFVVRAALREERSLPVGAAEAVVVGNIDGSTGWGAALAGVDFVIHAAARAHVLHDQSKIQGFTSRRTRREPVDWRSSLRIREFAGWFF
jgi:uncharacterized protein YbjT (DUF2867 family)